MFESKAIRIKPPELEEEKAGVSWLAMNYEISNTSVSAYHVQGTRSQYAEHTYMYLQS